MPSVFPPPPPPRLHSDAVAPFLIRWLRGNTQGGFDVIEGATSLDHAADANQTIPNGPTLIATPRS